MDVFIALYVVTINTVFGRWLRDVWEGKSLDSDRLRLLFDLRGEVTAWGKWPHATILDALTTDFPDVFAEIIKKICRLCRSPEMTPTKLDIFQPNVLVVKCESPELQRIRHTVILATRHLVKRMPLADEEFQRAEWHIQQVGKDTEKNRQALFAARKRYIQEGAPPLPSSRHFRLGLLVRLCKEGSIRRLSHFLKYGEPWGYMGDASLHITLASGLHVVDDKDKQQQLDQFQKSLWPEIEQRLQSYRPDSLGIMGYDPDPNNQVTVQFFDWLTETFVEETRPGFTVVDSARFAD